jgi:hypothetical protein
MWLLLRESCGEIALRPIALLQCFWPTFALYCLILALVFAGVLAEYDALIGLFVIFVLVTTPGVVRWHRHVIEDDKVSWLPRLPDQLSLAYLAKILAAFFVFTAIQKIGSSIAHDLALPIYGAIIGGRELHPFEWFLVPAFATFISIIAFVSIFGKWMLHLPEGALNPSNRGLRERWPPNGRSSFKRALGFVYLVPLLTTLVQTSTLSDDSVTTALVDTAIGLASALVGLSLLTVAYRKNIDHAGQTFEGVRKQS